METQKKLSNKRIHLLMPIELYELLKKICNDRGMTATKYILRAVIARLQMETDHKF